MRVGLLAVATIGVLTGGVRPSIARSGPPPLLPRTDKWLVSYDDDSCTLAGIFGDADHRIIARLTWFEPGDAFQLMLVGRQMANTGTKSSIAIDFGPTVNAQRREASVGTSGKSPMLLLTGVRLDDLTDVPLPKVTSQQEAAVEWVDLRIGGRALRLGLQTFGKAMVTIHACQSSLVKSWGLDPDRQASLSKPVTPINSPATWLNSFDYPMTALSQGHNGLVRFRLDVSDAGAVTGCHVQMAMKPADFEKVTCDLVRRRAKLSPALDKDGKPIASYYVNAVHWVAG